MKMMLTFSAFISCIAFITSCSPQLAPVGHYQDTNIIADGDANDWGLPLRFSNVSHTFQYSVSNDKKNIYICILTNDPGTQLQMLRSGINIYFDNKGEKNKNISLEFPVSKPDENTYNNGDPITAATSKNAIDQLLLKSNYYNTTGFANIENGQFDINDKKSNIKVALKFHDDSTLVYEAIVPVNDIPGIDPNKKSTSKNFSVGITVSAPRFRRNSNNNSSRPTFGMHGMRFGGGGNRGGSQRNQQPKEETEWYQFRLAFNNSNK
ncbi:MAG TPA: hypothetical protein VHZ50_13835 [Puia sp.]|jgi:hypothetical protein|nr:hypothetical protein [Puia sp.]